MEQFFFCFHRLPCIFPSMSPQANCIRFHNHEYLKIYRLTRFQLKFIQFNNIKKEFFFIGRTFAGEMNFTFKTHKKSVCDVVLLQGYLLSFFIMSQIGIVSEKIIWWFIHLLACALGEVHEWYSLKIGFYGFFVNFHGESHSSRYPHSVRRPLSNKAVT